VRWHEISSNPENYEVMTFRYRSVAQSKRQDVESLQEFISMTLGGCSVLDIGYANHSSETSDIASKSTHDMVKLVASRILGVDLVCSNLENTDTAEYFQGDLLCDQSFREKVLDGRSLDVLFAGNILEHLDSPASLLNLFVAMHSKCGTQRLVVLVPNPLWLIGIFDILRPNQIDLSLNVDHVNLFYPGAIVELSERHELMLDSWRYVGRDDMVRRFAPRPRKSQLVWAMGYWISRWRKLPFSYNQTAFEISIPPK